VRERSCHACMQVHRVDRLHPHARAPHRLPLCSESIGSALAQIPIARSPNDRPATAVVMPSVSNPFLTSKSDSVAASQPHPSDRDDQVEKHAAWHRHVADTCRRESDRFGAGFTVWK
jgi:hypothetical protein